MHYQPWSAWLERFIYCDDVLVHDGFYAGNMFNIPNPVGYLYSCGNMADGMRPLFSNLSVVINSTQYIKEELKLAPAAGVIGTPTFNVGS
jgi:hypothetical protein